MSALSELLNRHIAERFGDKSNRQIAAAAGVSRGTIDNYRNGIHPPAPSEDILQAFHILLRIPLTELREAAGVPRGEAEPYSPPPEFNRLSHSQRAALDEFVRSFVGPQGAADDDSEAKGGARPKAPPPPHTSDPGAETHLGPKQSDDEGKETTGT